MANYSPQYAQMFDYLSAPQLPTTPEAVVAFGRKDPLVALAIGELVIPSLAEIVVITGGIGKDSGDILEQGFRSEAHYLEDQLQQDAKAKRYDLPPVLLEEKASNGGENARNSLDILAYASIATASMTAVAHATSARRLGETLRHESLNRGNHTHTIHIKPSGYAFNPTNPVDQAEARAELLRIADWPSKGWLQPQSDIPEELVEFARDQSSQKTPTPPSKLSGAVLRALPPKLQARLLNRISR